MRLMLHSNSLIGTVHKDHRATQAIVRYYGHDAIDADKAPTILISQVNEMTVTHLDNLWLVLYLLSHNYLFCRVVNNR